MRGREPDLEPADVFELLADDCARRIIAMASVESRTARELAERLDASERTVYRRLEQLESMGLLQTGMEIDPGGHHRTLYETALKSVLVELGDGAYTVRIDFEEDAPDRLARIWGEMRGG